MSQLDTASVRRTVFALGALIVLGTVLTVLAGFASPPADEPLYLLLRDWDFLAGWGALSLVHSGVFVAALALLVLLGMRCRALLALVAGALLAGGLLALLLQAVVARPRPFDSPLSGNDSYPSPAILLLSVLAILVPVAVWVLTGSRAARVAVAALLWLVTGSAALLEVYDAERWPLDEAGAMVIGAGIAAAALLALSEPALHRRCAGCPWQEKALPHGPAAPAPAPRPLTGAERRGHPLYRAALVWAVGLAVVLGVLAVVVGIPRLPESGVMGTGLEAPLNVFLLLLIVGGVLLAARWHATGAIVVALAASLLGYASSVHYAPWVAAVVTAVAFVPALLLWVQWHRVSSVRSVLGMATVTAVVLGVVGYYAATNYTAFWGPTHPTSATPGPSDERVRWMWAGAVTPTSVNIRARTVEDADRVRLVVGEGPSLRAPAYSSAVPATVENRNVVSLTVDGLEPDREYHYALELDGEVDRERVQTFTTFPQGPSSFTFAVASCSRTGSNGMVYDAIREQGPLFYLNVGDWYYGDIDRDDPALYRRQYEANLTSPAQAALYASTSFTYVWDDHDFAGNDSDGSSRGKPAAMQVYREHVPHYPLRGPDAPLFQTFTVGDVRFVLTDHRSMRDPDSTPPEMLGEEQLQWLLDELARADRYGLVVWANGAPWVGEPDPGSDRWVAFPEERRVIADAIAEHEIDNLLMVSGDAHMLAFDDGTNTDYSSSGNDGFPLFHAAALDRRGSVKGGPYTGPVLPGGGQFGTVHVRDDGERVRVTVVGRNWRDEVLFRRTVGFSR